MPANDATRLRRLAWLDTVLAEGAELFGAIVELRRDRRTLEKQVRSLTNQRGRLQKQNGALAAQRDRARERVAHLRERMKGTSR